MTAVPARMGAPFAAKALGAAWVAAAILGVAPPVAAAVTAVAATTAPARPSAQPEPAKPSPSGAGPLALAPLSGALKGTPFEDFDEDDSRYFLDAARGALVAPVGATRRWANDASGTWGLVGATRDFRRSGSACRELRGEHVIARRIERFRVVACRTAKGEWRVASSGPVRSSSPSRPAMPARPAAPPRPAAPERAVPAPLAEPGTLPALPPTQNLVPKPQ